MPGMRCNALEKNSDLLFIDEKINISKNSGKEF